MLKDNESISIDWQLNSEKCQGISLNQLKWFLPI